MKRKRKSGTQAIKDAGKVAVLLRLDPELAKGVDIVRGGYPRETWIREQIRLAVERDRR